MALAAGAATLGVSLAVAAGSADAPGIAAWISIGAALCAQLPVYCGVFNPTLGTPMVSAAGVINPGSGALVALPAAPMGLVLAASAGSIDAAGIAKWTAVASVLVNWVGAYGRYGPAGLIGFVGPSPGAVTGTGLVQFANEAIGPDLALAVGVADAVGIATWTAIGAAILTTIKASGQIAPGAMVNPGTGGPVTGLGIFS